MKSIGRESAWRVTLMSGVYLLVVAAAVAPASSFAFCSPDGITQTCFVCGQQSSQVCVNGMFTPCQAAEICNNCDDDRDGSIDNASGQGSNTLSRPCSTTACAGRQTCVAGGWQPCTNCVPKSPPVSCTTACNQSSTYSCDYTTCRATCNSPYAEACNGTDDDCDGSIDDGAVCRQDCCPATCGSRCGTIPSGDGCGGPLTCPSCPSGQVCTSTNTCCTKATCTGFCGAGVPDGCGGTMDCGQTCAAPYYQCSASHTCVCPTLHGCTGFCGTNVPDGCGGTIASCGGCPTGQVCTASHTCCTPRSCSGKCGIQDNGCGGTMNCGGCSSGTCCDGRCQPNCW